MFLLYPPVPAMVANIPKPIIKRNGIRGLLNRIINNSIRVDFFTKPPKIDESISQEATKLQTLKLFNR